MTGPFYSNAEKNSSPKRCLCQKKNVATFEMCSVGSDLCNRVVIGMCGKRAADLDPGRLADVATRTTWSGLCCSRKWSACHPSAKKYETCDHFPQLDAVFVWTDGQHHADAVLDPSSDRCTYMLMKRWHFELMPRLPQGEWMRIVSN